MIEVCLLQILESPIVYIYIDIVWYIIPNTLVPLFYPHRPCPGVPGSLSQVRPICRSFWPDLLSWPTMRAARTGACVISKLECLEMSGTVPEGSSLYQQFACIFYSTYSHRRGLGFDYGRRFNLGIWAFSDEGDQGSNLLLAAGMNRGNPRLSQTPDRKPEHKWRTWPQALNPKP